MLTELAVKGFAREFPAASHAHRTACGERVPRRRFCGRGGVGMT